LVEIAVLGSKSSKSLANRVITIYGYLLHTRYNPLQIAFQIVLLLVLVLVLEYSHYSYLRDAFQEMFKRYVSITEIHAHFGAPETKPPPPPPQTLTA
jgi:hypothetical protein